MQLLDIATKQSQQSIIIQEKYEECKQIIPEGINSYIFQKQYDFLSNECLSISYKKNLSSTSIDDLIKQFHIDNQLTKEKEFIFNEFLYSLSEVYRSLKPLSEVLDIDYQISLVGGSLRDFLLDKPIKDLDIVFAISDIKGFSHPSLTNENSKWMVKDYGMSKADMKKLTDLQIKSLEETTPDSFTMKGVWYHLEEVIKLLEIPHFYFDSSKKTSKTEQFLFHVMHHLLQKRIKISEYFPPRTVQNEEIYESTNEVWSSGYCSNALRGVIKSTDSKFLYPVDILFVKNDTDTYTSGFDFELCRIALEYRYEEKEILELLSKNNSKKDIEKAYKKMVCSTGFVDDIANKTLTFLLGHESQSSIEFSLTNHYRRIKNKYPDFNFNLKMIDESNTIKEETKNFIKKLLDYEHLNNLLVKKDDTVVEQKRKKI